ncbi:hypothetical protein FHS96_003547 [Sphingomonas zeicaulis]|uniref:hypothetical protein n=1 Tax=Sphingomonas zeicaulis TaxID=1632740 RepID=UPI003D21E288
MRFRHVSLLLMFAAISPAAAKPPSDVADLVGARGAAGESALQQRGYIFIRTETGDDRKWSNWWHAARRQCLSVVTLDGRYASITAAPAPDCSQRSSAARDERWSDEDRTSPVYRRSTPQVGSPSYADRGPAGADDGGADLGLVCFGDGQRPQIASSSEWTWNSRSRRYDYGTLTDLTQEHFDASLMLQLWPASGRIRLPKKLIPPIHSRGQDDWWDLDNVVVGRDTITASYRLNGLNKPRLTVDRRSGRITVVGTGDYAFRGTCDLIGDGSKRRF